MLVLVLSLIVLSNVVSGDAAKARGYYWRYYFNGAIPSDAFPGGVDKAGNPTYIGQMFVKDYGLLPATIVNGSNNALATSHDETFINNKHVMILCSVRQQKFKWLDSTAGIQYVYEKPCHPVEGGEENYHVLLIGRTTHNGETIVGRVVKFGEGDYKLQIPYDGWRVNFNSYQILTFGCTN